MKILLSILLIIAAACIFIGFIFFNRKRAQEKDYRGITWSNIKRQTDIIKELNGRVGEAHIDEEYARKLFRDLDRKDKIISILSVVAMALVVLAFFLLLLDDMGPI